MIYLLMALLPTLRGQAFGQANFYEDKTIKLVNGFSAAGFLTQGTSGPLHSAWISLGESKAALSVVEPMVKWGQILTGFALFFGMATRFALIWGGAMMFLFYLAQFPPEHDLFMEYYLVYILVYMILGALGAGRILGVDRFLEKTPLVKRYKWLRYLLG